MCVLCMHDALWDGIRINFQHGGTLLLPEVALLPLAAAPLRADCWLGTETHGTCASS